MKDKEQLHGSQVLPHQSMWQPLDSAAFTEVNELEDNTILTLFEEQVVRHPEKDCILFRDQSLSYIQLDRIATAIGQKLHEMGIGPEDRVAIIAERSLEMVAGVYGILKSGAAYVPIDVDYPTDRISYILEDAAPKAVLLYHAEIMTSIPTIDLGGALQMSPIESVLPEVLPENLAYLIYTSGTSGKPKGVMIEQRNVVNYSLQTGHGVLRYLPKGTGDCIVSLTNFVFDIFVTELLVAPMLGMTVILADDREQIDAGALKELMEHHPASIMQTTPSRVQLYLSQENGEEALQSFSYIMLGGEAVSAQLVRRIHRINPTARIIDVYGPSETTVWSTCADVTEGEVTIGTPITNTQVYILDGMELCPVGKAGELCIGGAGVARGYLNRPQLTEEKFITNPFGRGRIYRTGDLALWREDGNLEFLGRIDDQVKIRGTRIELGEIDAVIREVPGVKDCAVIARENEKGEKELYAFLTSSQHLDLNDIRNRMREFLPDCMIPAYFSQIDKIPLNANGKLDKRALPTDAQLLSQTYIPPETENEELLCRLFGEILGVDRVGVTDNFFAMGGHSLRLIRLTNRIQEEFNCDLNQRDVFGNPTPRQLSLQLNKALVAGTDPIVSHPEISYLPASPAQRRLFYHEQVRGDDYSYHLPSVYSLDKGVSVSSFRQAFHRMIRRHEILRTVFVLDNGVPYQKILPEMDPELTEISDNDTSPEDLIRQWIVPFDLSKGPLIRGRLVHREEDTLLLLDMHHIISDGISVDIFCSELAALYDGKRVSEVKLQYKDYCLWLSNRDLRAQRDYWFSQYLTEAPVLELPTDYHRSLSSLRRGNMIQLPLCEEVSMELSSFARSMGVSEYMVFLSAAYILLSKHSGQEDLVIGSAFSGRTTGATEGMLGMFVSTLPIRGCPKKDVPFIKFLEEVRDLSFRGQENQEYPFENLIQDLNIQRDPTRNPLFDVMLVMQNNDSASYDSSTLKMHSLGHFHFGTTFDLTFNIEHIGKTFCISLQYSEDLFRESTAGVFLQHFSTLLRSILDHPESDIASLSMISPEEQILLESFRGTDGYYDREATIIELFEKQVKRDPDAIAIVCDNESITYGELNRKANLLGRRLLQEGIGPEDCVALLLPQSIERFVGIYGVLKAGGAYVPIDPAYPKDRIDYILSDCNAKLLLTMDSSANFSVPMIDLGDPTLWIGTCQDPPSRTTSQNLAYCIYTSGTTGKPKGVMVEHHGVSNLKSYFETILGISPSDRILQFANYVFDGSVWEMNMALLNGARLILVTDQMDLGKICDTMERENVTVASFPPNLYAQLKDVSPRILVTAGSASDRGIVEKARHSRYINSYGPTECTVAATHWEGEVELSFVPIGKPIPNTRVYILRGTDPCAIGVPGEICVGGAGLARGYLGQDQLTAERFIPNPFGKGRLYRTGDMGLLMPDGNIRFLGRMDDQVKVRGYRVEPYEIDACLRELSYIDDCAVVVGQDSTNENAIFAYVVSRESLSFDIIRRDLKKKLPDYMLPSYFMQLDRIPVTVNGKVDKKGLPQISIRSDSEYIAPRNPKEKVLVDALKEILSLDTLSVKDSFFEMGGDSIKAIRMVSYLRERNMSITVKDIMENGSIEEIAFFVEELHRNTYEQGECIGLVKDTPMLRLFRHWNLSKPEHFNQAVILPMEVSEDELRYGLNAITKHHDLLRGIYDDGKLVIRPYAQNEAFELMSYSVPKTENPQDWIQSICVSVQSSIRLKEGPLVKACLFDTGMERVVMLAVHHLLIDSVSWHILLEDLQTAVSMYRKGKQLQLPLKTASFQQWADVLEDYSVSEDLQKEAPYWNAVQQAVSQSKLQYDSYRSSDRREIQFALTPSQTEELISEACNTYHTQINDLLLAALALTVEEFSGQEQIAVCLEGHGREPIHVPMDIDRTIGWFTCAYPVILKCTDSIGEAIIETKEMLRKVPNHGLGYGLLYPSSSLDEISIYFNYIGQSEESGSLQEFSYSAGSTIGKENIFGGLININAGIYDGALTFDMIGGKGWEASPCVERIGKLYHDMLLRVLHHCMNAEESYHTFADVDAEDLEDHEFDEINALLGLF